MKNLLVLTLIPVGVVLCMSPANAAKEAQYGSFGIGVGTGGLGFDYAYPLHRNFDLRAGYDFGSLNREQEEDGVDYDVELKFSAIRLLVDYKPFGGGFRITGGLYTGSPELELEANGADEYDIGDNTYNGDLQARGLVDLGSSSPYLGLGWGGTAGTTGFGMSFDLGVLFTGSPTVQLSVPSGRACNTFPDPNCDPNSDPNSFDVSDNSAAAQAFRDDVALERQNLQDDAEDFDLWPIIRVGFHYRF